MNRLLQNRYLVRENLVLLVGACLFFYFGYHALAGERSILRLNVLNNEIATLSLEHDTLAARRMALESRVRMMRPGSINKDLLEEQVREVLGYSRKDEIILVSPPPA
jgi:cell division protein FtsB